MLISKSVVLPRFRLQSDSSEVRSLNPGTAWSWLAARATTRLPRLAQLNPCQAVLGINTHAKSAHLVKAVLEAKDELPLRCVELGPGGGQQDQQQ